jgi:hypothetical protein
MRVKNYLIIQFFLCWSFLYAQWTGSLSNYPLVIPGGSEPYAVSDGLGGAIVVSNAYGTSSYFLVIQRINGEGFVKWTEPGKALLVTNKNSEDETGEPLLKADGAGGTYLAYCYKTFIDFNDGFLVFEYDLYLQHFDSTGHKKWPEKGLPVCTLEGLQRPLSMVDDGDGGIILFFEDYRESSSAIYAQRISAGGEIMWEENGKFITHLYYMDLIRSDHQGGAYMFARFQPWGGQHITSNGELLWNENDIWTGVSIRFGTIIEGPNGSSIIAGTKDGADSLHAQKISADGKPLWGEQGIRWREPDAPYDRWFPEVTGDGQGGVLAFWETYMQHIDSAGTVIYNQTPYKTMAVEDYYGVESVKTLSSSEVILCFWRDYSLFLQKILPNGQRLWGDSGIVINKEEIPNFEYPLVTDDQNNVIIIFEKLGSKAGIYAQKINPSGDIVTSISQDEMDNTIDMCTLTAYPNPFNSQVLFQITIPAQFKNKTAYLDIYNILGSKVKSMRKEVNASNEIRIEWNGTDEYGRQGGAGVYIAIFHIEKFKKMAKVINLK